MSDEYYIVSSKVLPEVFAKVVQAKRLLGTGAAHSASEAARLVGISRSAFYKYKDAIFEPSDMAGGKGGVGVIRRRKVTIFSRNGGTFRHFSPPVVSELRPFSCKKSVML